MFSMSIMKVAFVWLRMGTLEHTQDLLMPFPRRTLTNTDVAYSLYPLGFSKKGDPHYQDGIQSCNN